mmetsp:Transcript_3587/g.6185  ORF Transcript_3587/g.6185 Transcript_3587/m.6185 type:complete len:365 (+) Transcript_3587:10-1104(+)
MMAKSSTKDDTDAVNDAHINDDTSMKEMSAVEEANIVGATADDTNDTDVPIEEEDENDTNNEDKVEEADRANDDDEHDDDVASKSSEKDEENEDNDKDAANKSNSKDNNDGTPSKKRPAPSNAPPPPTSNEEDNTPLPTLPLKKGRTAYFLFANDKREELKQKYQGEGVAALSKATGELWKQLQPAEKEVYETQAAQEREKYRVDKQRLIDAGVWPESGGGSGGGGANDAGEYDEDGILFPIGRIRKICKLDGDVKGMSKEATLLVAKATELFASRLGSEVVTMAQMSNRRKLMPDDVVEVCSVKERFMFLKDDLQDLIHEQKEVQKEKENEKASSGSKSDKSWGGGKPTSASLLSYFGKVHND